MLLKVQADRRTERVIQAMAFEVEAEMPRTWVTQHLFRAMFTKGRDYLKSCGLEWTGEPVRLEGPLPVLPVAMDGTVTSGDANDRTGMVRYRMVTAFLQPVRDRLSADGQRESV